MGKVDSQHEPTIQHFSHEHPLQLLHFSNKNPHFQNNPTCSSCNLNLSDLIYSCPIPECNFFLHLSCANLPQQINHPCHHAHPFFLFSSKTPHNPLINDPNPISNCGGCGHPLGNGFYYSCRVCNIGLHTSCANMPLLVVHNSHQHHLTLLFSSPYGNNNSFSCDICHNLGFNQWLYRCNLCEFDAHLGCADAPLPSHSPGSFQDPSSSVAVAYPLQQQGSFGRNLGYGNNAVAVPNHYGSQMVGLMGQGRFAPGALNRSGITGPKVAKVMQGVLKVGLGVGLRVGLGINVADLGLGNNGKNVNNENNGGGGGGGGEGGGGGGGGGRGGGWGGGGEGGRGGGVGGGGRGAGSSSSPRYFQY